MTSATRAPRQSYWNLAGALSTCNTAPAMSTSWRRTPKGMVRTESIVQNKPNWLRNPFSSSLSGLSGGNKISRKKAIQSPIACVNVNSSDERRWRCVRKLQMWKYTTCYWSPTTSWISADTGCHWSASASQKLCCRKRYDSHHSVIEAPTPLMTITSIA